MTKKSLDYKKITFLILAAGILVRALYVIFMPVVNFAQYDIGTVDLDNNVLTGHLGYIFFCTKITVLCLSIRARSISSIIRRFIT